MAPGLPERDDLPDLPERPIFINADFRFRGSICGVETGMLVSEAKKALDQNYVDITCGEYSCSWKSAWENGRDAEKRQKTPAGVPTISERRSGKRGQGGRIG